MRRSFSLLPCHLCSMNALMQNRKHLAERQLHADTRAPFTSNLILLIGLDIRYLMLAAVCWFLVSSQYISAQNPNTSIGRENHSCLPADLQLCISSSSVQDHVVQQKGLLMWELATSEHTANASLPSISPGFFNQPVAVNLPAFRH